MKMIVRVLLLILATSLSARAYPNRSIVDTRTNVKEYDEIGEEETLFLNAVSDFLNGRSDAARTELEATLSICPVSRLWKVALLTLADSFYIEGGSENLREAEAGYRKFLLLFPDDIVADEVRIKLADTDIRWMWFRDLATGLRMAERQLEDLISLNPASRKRKAAEARLAQIHEQLAEHLMRVARFYYDLRDALEAARQRSEEILNKYPNYSRFDEALFYHARSMADQGDIQAAGEDLSRLLKLYSYSEYRDQAESLMERWGLSVPEREPASAGSQKKRENIGSRPFHGISITDVKTLPAEGVILDRNLTVVETLARAQRICSVNVGR